MLETLGEAVLTSAQEVIELTVFRSFANICPLNIVPASVEKRKPPHPDIWCVVEKCGPVAFELAEILDPAFARQVDGGYDLRRKFKRVCERFPKVKKSLQNATVHIDFYQRISKSKQISSIEPILEVLAKLDSRFEGSILIPKHTSLSRVVRTLEVRRGALDGPFFDFSKFMKHVDRSLDIIRNKFTKSYKSTAPVEFLAYFYRQPPHREEEWLAEIQTYIAGHLKESDFRRVWVYDHFIRKNLYVYS